tara:strand:- start:543 stop:1004 length:462 start_codon:yes stop_codon:yes gene_type:complete
MKAIEINGEIKVYNELPGSWKGVMGNFSKLSEEEIKAYGFYDVVMPDFDNQLEELGNIFFNESIDAYTYPVNEKNILETLDQLKENKKNQLKFNINNKLKETDWYYIRKLQRNIDIPAEIEAERNTTLDEYDIKKEEINALTQKTEVIKYELE